MLIFRQLERKDFKGIRNLALKGWYFAYSHLDRKELRKLVEEYYSDGALVKSLGNIKAGRQCFILAFEGENLVGFDTRREFCQIQGE
ncbi:MAG: hypothetical protein HY518_04210 [Candidatus Aenigmarchaeota archaeon]|nr:hypothetical protein [Candidatus Aenigmarchaeota archaeon]